jgi:hypothetical protein
MPETIQIAMDEQGRCDWSSLRPHAVQAREVIACFSEWVPKGTAPGDNYTWGYQM